MRLFQRSPFSCCQFCHVCCKLCQTKAGAFQHIFYELVFVNFQNLCHINIRDYHVKRCGVFIGLHICNFPCQIFHDFLVKFVGRLVSFTAFGAGLQKFVKDAVFVLCWNAKPVVVSLDIIIRILIQRFQIQLFDALQYTLDSLFWRSRRRRGGL